MVAIFLRTINSVYARYKYIIIVRILEFEPISNSGAIYMFSQVFILCPMPGAVRYFSTSSRRCIGFSDLFKNLTSWKQPKKVSKVVDPTKQGDSASNESIPEDSEPRKLKMLGKSYNIQKDWPKVEKFTQYSAWPTNLYRSELTADNIEHALQAAFPEGDASVADIFKRFAGIKEITKTLNIAIPDSEFSSFKTVNNVKEHLLSVSRKYDERQPDAVYLDAKDFVGTNITLSDPVMERRSRKERYQKLLKEARKARREQAKEALA